MLAAADEHSEIDLSVVIVNWNVCDLLRRCLGSVLRDATQVDGLWAAWRIQAPGGREYRMEVLVVDSASSDESVAMVQREFPTVRLVASKTNLGYAGGNNLGILEARGRYVMLLNPDTEVLNDALVTMLSFMEEHERVGVVGPRLLWPDGTVQSSRRRFPSLCTALVDSTIVEKWCPGHRQLRWYKMLDVADGVRAEVDWLVGACVLVRRAAIDQIGLLDDRFFMYSEELDWQKRLKAAGWKVVYLPSAEVVHAEGRSSGQVAAWRHLRFSQSKVYYFRKHHGSVSGEIVREWLLLNYVCEWIVEALKWCVGHKRGLRLERMHAYGEVLRSGLRG